MSDERITIIGGDGSKWLSDLQAENDNMSYDHKPQNANKGGVSRSGQASGFHYTDRPMLGWKAAVLIGGLIGALLLVGIMQWPQSV